VLILDESGGIASEATAGFRPLLSEPTLHAFSPELVEDAVRNTYQADESGVVYSLVLAGEALRYERIHPGNIATVAGQMAAVWNENARVPGVTDIVETQEVSPLGSLDDIFQVSVESASGLFTSILTVTPNQIRPDVFAQVIAREVAALNAAEAAR
jgi:hypothetical protein